MNEVTSGTSRNWKYMYVSMDFITQANKNYFFSKGTEF